MKDGSEHVKTECQKYGVFSACCIVTTVRWRTPGNVYEQRTGGREWESNPPRTGRRPFPDLKSGRPTRDASLPLNQIISLAARAKLPPDCLLHNRNLSAAAALFRCVT